MFLIAKQFSLQKEKTKTKSQRADEEAEEYGFTYDSEKRNGLHLKNKNGNKYLEITGKGNDAPFSQRDSLERQQGSAA